MASVNLTTDFAGRRAGLFWLALKTSLITVLTLGLYRFWMKTRLRRYYWSSIRPGGLPLEYVGEPMEKLLGFLIAVVFLSFYIGVVNLILMFISFSLLQGNFAAYLASFIGVIPIWFYARYRARRYILARTRWRGLRFGMTPGAWGYAWRALVHWLITIGSLGLLWPRMTFYLEKFRAERSFFGETRITQNGRWGGLYKSFLPLILGILLSCAFAGAIYLGEDIAALGFLLSFPLCLYGWVNYQVKSFAYLTNAKTAGEIGFIARPRRWRVLAIYLFGNFLIYAVLGLILFGLFFVVFFLAGLFGQSGFDPDDLLAAVQTIPQWLFIPFSLMSYFAFFIIWDVLTQVFRTLPLMRHYAETLTITGAPHLASVQQRARDELSQAEGFAEALDVGAAI